MNKEAFEKVLKMSEEFFGTESDPEQMSVSEESARKLWSIHPDTVLYAFEGGEPVAWVVIVPTSADVMEKFLAKKISERDLLDLAAAEKKFEALYVCGAFVLPDYRRKGYAKELLLKGIRILSQGKDIPLYAWVYSDEGRKLTESLSRTLGKEIISRSLAS
jgi:GNAT superfamily N-acetyltransferase